MQRRRGSKPVVYLDQNWISNITKSYMNDWNSSDKPFYERLSSAIQEGVANNRFVCPTSEFHECEASYGSNIKDSLWYVAKTLSRELSFSSSIQINHLQLVEAALEFTMQDLPDTPWWIIPFNRNPDTQMDGLPEKTVEVHFSMDEWAEENKRIRDGLRTSQYDHFKKNRRQHGLTYEAEVEFGRKQLFLEGHVGSLPEISLPEFSESKFRPIFLLSALEIMNRAFELKETYDKGGGINIFLESRQFVEAPFLSIYAKLRAADIVRFPDRDPEPSLLEDFAIMATVVPYTNAVATENYMAELIRQTRIDEEYDCRTFTMREKQGFLEYLMNLE